MELITQYIYSILTFGFYDISRLDSITLNQLLIEFIVFAIIWVALIKFIKWVLGV